MSGAVNKKAPSLMSIRVTCDNCGSVLKIKEELAGTQGRCPKCKTKFTVPQAGEHDEGAAARPEPPADAKAEEFDPVAFLMADDGPRAATRAAAPAPAAVEGPPATPAERRPSWRKPDAKPGLDTAAGAADAMLKGSSASTNAKDLLTRTMDESRARAAQMPTDPQREPIIDVRELFRELGVKIIPLLIGVIIATVAVYWLADQVTGRAFKPPDLGYVSGTVTAGGKPLAGATVEFRPLDKDANSSMAVTDEKGAYTLYYVEGVKGAVLGMNRVLVELLDERGRTLVPPDGPYGMVGNTKHKVESGSQTIDLKIP